VVVGRIVRWLRDEEASDSTRAMHLTTIRAGLRLPCSACLPACLPACPLVACRCAAEL